MLLRKNPNKQSDGTGNDFDSNKINFSLNNDTKFNLDLRYVGQISKKKIWKNILFSGKNTFLKKTYKHGTF